MGCECWASSECVWNAFFPSTPFMISGSRHRFQYPPCWFVIVCENTLKFLVHTHTHTHLCHPYDYTPNGLGSSNGECTTHYLKWLLKRLHTSRIASSTILININTHCIFLSNKHVYFMLFLLSFWTAVRLCGTIWIDFIDSEFQFLIKWYNRHIQNWIHSVKWIIGWEIQ